MNNTIKLAVASALLAAASSASAAGGIVAGDWTLDIVVSLTLTLHLQKLMALKLLTTSQLVCYLTT